ncbi:hypothetical protein CCACVL1_14317 [Corchorus capsularis]|uniref:Uncharacterized protein n=1 Tax=Corchorus capsularis TaxID=210143 RepID=A0A1R3I7I0_COCAP|nr:hypothetical protein CCACVL1_14317 [Corchorus capsularis]
MDAKLSNTQTRVANCKAGKRRRHGKSRVAEGRGRVGYVLCRDINQ